MRNAKKIFSFSATVVGSKQTQSLIVSNWEFDRSKQENSHEKFCD